MNNPAAVKLGRKGGKEIAKRGAEYFRQLQARRKRRKGGRPPGSCRDNRLDELCFGTFCFSVSARVIGAPGSERILLPKRASAFWEGHKKSSMVFHKSSWEEPEKQKTR